MFAHCLSLEKNTGEIQVHSSRKEIRIGGSPQKKAALNTSLSTDRRSRHGIEMTGSRDGSKSSRSVDIKGPQMNIKKIQKEMASCNSRLSVTNRTVSWASSSRAISNPNEITSFRKPMVHVAVDYDHELKFIHNLETKTTEDSMVRVADFKPFQTSRVSLSNELWQKPYIPANIASKKKRPVKVLNTIESINSSEEGGHRSSILNSKEDNVHFFKPTINLVESQVGEDFNVKRSHIRMSESIMELTPRNISQIRILWSHSLALPDQQHTAIDKAINFVFNIKFIEQFDMEQTQFQRKIHKIVDEHPNILSHYHLLETDSRGFLFQQYFEDTLQNLVGRLSVRSIKSIAIHILDAIEWIHGRNVSHNNINCRSIVYVGGVYKLSCFIKAISEATQQEKKSDFQSFGRTLAVLIDNLQLDQQLQDSIMRVIFELQQGDCTIANLRELLFSIQHD